MCGHQARVPNEFQGRSIICPECRLNFTIPAVGHPPPVANETYALLPEPSARPREHEAVTDREDWYFKVLGEALLPHLKGIAGALMNE